MVSRILIALVPALLAGSALAGAPPQVGSVEVRPPAALQLAQCARYGPYATMRRANEVAAQARAYGYNAVVYPEWGAYYVNVC
jgi:hypothetical protein